MKFLSSFFLEKYLGTKRIAENQCMSKKRHGQIRFVAPQKWQERKFA
jgi:hypothetical protein